MVAKISMLRTLVGLAATAMFMEFAMAVSYTVGGSTGGWDTATNLQAWTSSQTFLVGDNLIFQYTSNHNVLEVSKADYDSCQTSSPIQMYTGSTSVIPLSAPGSQYFICGSAGHCSLGMKIQIDTLAASTAPPTSSPPLVASTPPPASSPPSLVTPPVSPVTPVSTPTALPTSGPTPPVSPLTPVSTPTALPTSGPTISPSSPSNSPSNSPTSPTILTTESPAISPFNGNTLPPLPSAANNGHMMVGPMVGFVFLMSTLLIL